MPKLKLRVEKKFTSILFIALELRCMSNYPTLLKWNILLMNESLILSSSTSSFAVSLSQLVAALVIGVERDCQIVSRQLSSSWDPVNEFLSPPNRHIRLPPEGFYEEVCGCVSTEEILV